MRLCWFAAVATCAYGCSCKSDPMRPVCQWSDSIGAAFTATVVEAGPAVGREPYWYRVRVNERFRGVEESIGEVNVLTSAGTSCFRTYTVGDEYLFVGGELREPGEFRAFTRSRPATTRAIGGGHCSLHRSVKHAATDIAFLKQPSFPTTIFGSVFSGSFNIPRLNLASPPLKGALVRVSGPDGELTQSTGENGSFQFQGVAPGMYRVNASLEGYNLDGPVVADVPPNGCGVAYFGAEGDAVITGRVVNFDGTPAPGLELEAVFPRSLWTASGVAKAQTWKDGTFRLSRVSAGELLVRVVESIGHGVPATYWPGVTKAEKAGRLRIKPGEVTRGLVIRLPKPADIRRVRVKVSNSDGSIPMKAYVGVGYSDVMVDDEGIAELKLLAGVPYETRAEAYIHGAGSGSVTIGPTATRATIVLK